MHVTALYITKLSCFFFFMLIYKLSYKKIAERVCEKGYVNEIRNAGPDPDRGHKPPRHPLVKQHSKPQAVQETTGVCGEQLATQVMESLTRGEALLDLLLIIREVKIRYSLGYSSHALLEVSTCR